MYGKGKFPKSEVVSLRWKVANGLTSKYVTVCVQVPTQIHWNLIQGTLVAADMIQMVCRHLISESTEPWTLFHDTDSF